MEKQLLQVSEFHRAIGEKVAASAELLDADSEADQALARALRELIAKTRSGEQQGSHLNRRALMAIEELAEWLEAHIEGDLVAAADAVGDRLYVLLGDAVATGLPLERVFEEVHRSNVTKATRDVSTGKGIKGSDFRRPELESLLETGSKEKE
jgi:predicted HAD superfamily Cof-like phosphohydrolase